MTGEDINRALFWSHVEVSRDACSLTRNIIFISGQGHSWACVLVVAWRCGCGCGCGVKS